MDNFEQLWTGESVRRCSAVFDRVRSGLTASAWFEGGQGQPGGPWVEGGWRKIFRKVETGGRPVFCGGGAVEGGWFWKVLVDLGAGFEGCSCSDLFGPVRTCSVLFEAVWSLRGPHPPPARGQAPTLSLRERGPEQDLCATFLGERGAERDSGVTLPGERGPEVDRGEGVSVLLLLVIVRLSEGHVYDVMRRSSSWCWVERPETLGVGEGGGYGWLVSTGLLVVSKLSIVKYRNY